MPCPHPASDASFEKYIDFYTQREEITVNRLATCARLNQSYLYKIYKGWISDVSVDVLVSVCLALRLSLAEAKDLLARKERAFSPANEVHQVYMKEIEKYHQKEVTYKDREAVMRFLDEANKDLREANCPELPKNRNF